LRRGGPPSRQPLSSSVEGLREQKKAEQKQRLGGLGRSAPISTVYDVLAPSLYPLYGSTPPITSQNRRWRKNGGRFSLGLRFFSSATCGAADIRKAKRLVSHQNEEVELKAKQIDKKNLCPDELAFIAHHN
jgi:hypothetical protein